MTYTTDEVLEQLYEMSESCETEDIVVNIANKYYGEEMIKPSYKLDDLKMSISEMREALSGGSDIKGDWFKWDDSYYHPLRIGSLNYILDDEMEDIASYYTEILNGFDLREALNNYYSSEYNDELNEDDEEDFSDIIDSFLNDEYYEDFGLAYTTLNLNDEDGNTIEDEVAEMQASIIKPYPGKPLYYKIVYEIFMYDEGKTYRKEEVVAIDDLVEILNNSTFDCYYSEIVHFASELNLNLS